MSIFLILPLKSTYTSDLFAKLLWGLLGNCELLCDFAIKPVKHSLMREGFYNEYVRDFDWKSHSTV